MVLATLSNILTFYVRSPSIVYAHVSPSTHSYAASVISFLPLIRSQTYTLSIQPFLKGGLSSFASSISITMMSRLMLNLHEGAIKGLDSTVDITRGVMTTLGFSDPETTEEGTMDFDLGSVDHTRV
jgi:hypothetical protein